MGAERKSAAIPMPDDLASRPRDAEGGGGVRLRKFPYPYSAAATVASDTDNASYGRFAAIHALFCGTEIIRPGMPDWRTLGLTPESRWYDRSAGGVPGLGLEIADSFYLIGDAVSMGMFRFDPQARTFHEDVSDGHNASLAIREWIRRGDIDTFHGFLNYTRDQVLPLLAGFYRWCESEGIAKPSTWVNHSVLACPTGLCPDSLRPNRYYALARQIARFTIGPLTGRTRYPIVWSQPWYQGDKPGTPYYINDVLRANGLRYLWLGAGHDELANAIALPESPHGGRPSILEPVTMDDGSRYYRFRRCFGRVQARSGVTVALRTSKIAFDASVLFSAANLDHLCGVQGTCILFTHWTVERSLPIQDETIENFQRLRAYRDQRKIWVTRLSRLLEWTRLRTFLTYSAHLDARHLIIDIGALDDPIFGRRILEPRDCHGLAFDLPSRAETVEVRFAGRALSPESVRREGSICWLTTQV
ncbi:MAG: hypothetical protein ACXWF4_03575 [Candidatus Aminicenantales bacterium]